MRAVIVGGGIAGPVVGMALRKAGIEASLFEAYEGTADDAGAFLTLSANGQNALAAIDLDDQVRAHSFPANMIERWNGAGAQLGSAPIGGPEAGRVATRTIRRSVLYGILRDEAERRGVTLAYGKKLVSIAGDSGVRASFADGTHADGDLLIGADGVWSTTRALIDPDAPRPRFTELTVVFGYTDEVSDAAKAPPETYRMIRGGRAFFGHTTDPDGRTWWFARVPGVERDRADLAATTATEWRELTRAFFVEDNTSAADIIAATGEDILGGNAYDIPTSPVWHNDRMIVIGDAAHAASPAAAQGASMAIEDGIILAKCLRDIADVPTAFSTYERIRRDRVEKVVANGAKTGANVKPAAPRRPGDADWLYRHEIDWDTPVSAA